MTDAPMPERASVLARPRGRRRRRDLARLRRRRARAAAVSRLPDRRPGRSRARTRRSRTCSGPASGIPRTACHGARPGARPDRPARPAGDDQADGRAPHGGLGLGRDAGPALAADGRAGPRAHLVLAVGARRVRPAAGGHASRSSRTPRSTSSRGSSTSSRASGRTRPPRVRSTPTSSSASEHGFNASTFTARIVTSTRSDIASAVAAAIGTLKGPLHGGAPSEVVDQLNQIGSAERRRGMGPRDARARRSADGLRPPRLSGLRPAGRGPAQGRRGDAQPAGLAPARDRRRGRRRCGSSPRSTRSGRSRRTSSTTRRPSSWASA